MVEKLKVEPYILESLVARVYSDGGALVVERYDTIYWARDRHTQVKCSEAFDCYVGAKQWNLLSGLVKEAGIVGKSLRLTLFNGASYDLEMVDGNLPTFEFPKLPNRSVFDFGGVEKAVSKSPLQRELNMVYADSSGVVGSDSIMAGVCYTKFKSDTPMLVPEGIHSMLGGKEAEWGIIEEKLYIKFGDHEIVAVLPAIPSFAWWDASRGAFPEGVLEFKDIVGLKSSVQRLSNFGKMLILQDNKILINSEHWEPFSVNGNGEAFDVDNLLPILVDDKIGVCLYGGNLYLKVADTAFVCCSIDLSAAGSADTSATSAVGAESMADPELVAEPVVTPVTVATAAPEGAQEQAVGSADDFELDVIVD